METKKNSKSSYWLIKVALIVVSSLLLLIPLHMVKNLIKEREATRESVELEVAKSYGSKQVVGTPAILSAINVISPEGKKETKTTAVYPTKLDYKADVTTEVLKRSLYEVVVYNSVVEISGMLPIKDNAPKAISNKLAFEISDFKGLSAMPQANFNGKPVDFERVDNRLLASLDLPIGVKKGDEFPFSMTVKLKGTSKLMFRPLAEETSVSISSPYPHPSFQGDFLPDTRDVREDGFTASWNVLKINTSSPQEQMGVKFISPANPYQQAERSAKYGILIIALTFVAGLLVEFLTKKRIHGLQYLIIGLSLVLFYALLLSFSEFMPFGLAYLIAALMTTLALTFYFRGIMKSRCGYALGGLVAFMYAANYTLLQMETFGLLSGSILLFIVLVVIMYFTANINQENTEDVNPETDEQPADGEKVL